MASQGEEREGLTRLSDQGPAIFLMMGCSNGFWLIHKKSQAKQ